MRRTEWYFRIYVVMGDSEVTLTYSKSSYDRYDNAMIGFYKAIDEILELNIKNKKSNLHFYASPLYPDSINMELDCE